MSHRVMLAIFCLSLAVIAPAAWAQVPAKSAMTVGAVVVKPCQISDQDSKNICHTNIRKKKFENVSHLLVADTPAYDENLAMNGAFIEYEF